MFGDDDMFGHNSYNTFFRTYASMFSFIPHATRSAGRNHWQGRRVSNEVLNKREQARRKHRLMAKHSRKLNRRS